MAKALHTCNAHRPEDIAYAGDSATKRFNCRHRKRSHGQLWVCRGRHFKMATQNFQMPGDAVPSSSSNVCISFDIRILSSSNPL